VRKHRGYLFRTKHQTQFECESEEIKKNRSRLQGFLFGLLLKEDREGSEQSLWLMPQNGSLNNPSSHTANYPPNHFFTGSFSFL
jgi:hypothetical protein